MRVRGGYHRYGHSQRTPRPTGDITPLNADPVCGNSNAAKSALHFLWLARIKDLADVIVIVESVLPKAADASAAQWLWSKKAVSTLPQIVGGSSRPEVVIKKCRSCNRADAQRRINRQPPKHGGIFNENEPDPIVRRSRFKTMFFLRRELPEVPVRRAQLDVRVGTVGTNPTLPE